MTGNTQYYVGLINESINNSFEVDVDTTRKLVIEAILNSKEHAFIEGLSLIKEGANNQSEALKYIYVLEPREFKRLRDSNLYKLEKLDL
jgi:hypothetical protein